MKALSLLLAALCLLGGSLVAVERSGTKPNILFIYAEDIGHYTGERA